jgi:hypothetical protein
MIKTTGASEPELGQFPSFVCWFPFALFHFLLYTFFFFNQLRFWLMGSSSRKNVLYLIRYSPEWNLYTVR